MPEMPRSHDLKAEPRALARFIPRTVPPALRLPPEINRLDLLHQEGVEALLRELYNLLRDQGITCDVEPPAPAMAVRQPIRTIDTILTEKRGTCLDLSLLFCAVCLAHDLAPLLIVLEGHAFVAVATGRTLQQPHGEGMPAFERGMLASFDALRDQVPRLYLPVECTGFAAGAGLSREYPEGRGRERRDGCMSFDRAVRAGEEYLNAHIAPAGATPGAARRAFLYALDIVTLQDRYGFMPVGDTLPGDTRVYLDSAHAEGGAASVRNQGAGEAAPSALPDADRLYQRSAHAEGGGDARVENQGGSVTPLPAKARRTYIGSAHAEGGGNASVVNVPAPVSVARVEPATVLAVYAAPPGSAPLHWERDVRALREALAPYPDRFRLDVVPLATPEDVQRALVQCRPRYLHLFAHGAVDGILLDDGEGGRGWKLPYPLLAEMVRAMPGLRCVLLSACDSAYAASATGSGEPYLIAMRGKVSVDAAIAFAGGFYETLAAREDTPIEAAFAQGLIRLQLIAPLDAEVPLLAAGWRG
ncbi:CHAT domain-containing protein [Roseiflexus sp.]